MIRFQCPNCDSKMEIDESFGGRSARCPTCGIDLRVPKAGEAAAAAAAAGKGPARPGAATVKVDGEEVEIVPPLETMVILSLGFVALAVVCLLIGGLVLGALLQCPWTVGFTLGGVCALMGLLLGVPGYHNVRRSRGRRRGRTLAQISMAAGGGLFLICTVGALVGWVQFLNRPTCEENLKQIYSALRAYADKHEGAFPASLSVLVKEKYLKSADWLTCPQYGAQAGTQTYTMTTDINLNAKRPDGRPWWPDDMLLVMDGPFYDRHPDGVRILLLNGEIKIVPNDKWAVYQKVQGEKWNDILNKIRNPNAGKNPPDATEKPAEPAPGTPPGVPPPAAPVAPAKRAGP